MLDLVSVRVRLLLPNLVFSRSVIAETWALYRTPPADKCTSQLPSTHFFLWVASGLKKEDVATVVSSAVPGFNASMIYLWQEDLPANPFWHGHFVLPTTGYVFPPIQELLANLSEDLRQQLSPLYLRLVFVPVPVPTDSRILWWSQDYIYHPHNYNRCLVS